MIQVITFYQDIYGVRIQPGFYELNDPRLQNKGRDLLATGQAIEVKSKPDENLTPVNISTSEPAGFTLAPEFTRFALEVMSDNGITEDELIAFYPDVDKFSKSHVEDYLTASDD